MPGPVLQVLSWGRVIPLNLCFRKIGPAVRHWSWWEPGYSRGMLFPVEIAIWLTRIVEMFDLTGLSLGSLCLLRTSHTSDHSRQEAPSCVFCTASRLRKPSVPAAESLDGLVLKKQNNPAFYHSSASCVGEPSCRKSLGHLGLQGWLSHHSSFNRQVQRVARGHVSTRAGTSFVLFPSVTPRA